MSNVNPVLECAVCGTCAPCTGDSRARPICEVCIDDVEAGVSNRCDACDGPAPPGSDVCACCSIERLKPCEDLGDGWNKSPLPEPRRDGDEIEVRPPGTGSSILTWDGERWTIGHDILLPPGHRGYPWRWAP